MMTVCINVHALTANSMQASKYMDTLVFPPMCFKCFKGNVGNMTGTRKRQNRQKANMCHFVPYIM